MNSTNLTDTLTPIRSLLGSLGVPDIAITIIIILVVYKSLSTFIKKSITLLLIALLIILIPVFIHSCGESSALLSELSPQVTSSLLSSHIRTGVL